MQNLKTINNELKSYVNQASFISIKCRNKLIKLLGETYQIELPIENYANIDVQLTEEGNIIMRGDSYNNGKSLTLEETKEKYNEFKEKADTLLNKKELNYYNKKDINNILNIIIVIILVLAYVVVGVLFIKAILSLRLFTASILAALLSSYLAPGIKNRFEQAKNFLRRKLKK